MSFFKEKSDQEINLILDVGNGSVAGALVLFKDGLAPKIIYSKRLPLTVPQKTEKDKLSALVLHILEEVLVGISEEGLARLQELEFSNEKVTHTFCVLSSPWYISKTKILKIENDEPILINKNFIESLLQKEEGLFQEEVTQRQIGAISPDDIDVIEKKIIQTKLNGYITKDPYQKKARQIELAIFMSLASKNIVRSIETIVGRFFYSKNMMFTSYSLAEHNVVSDIFSNESDFVFMDISSEVTDISSVEKGILMETTSFPLGRNHLVAKVAEEFNVLPEIALSFIKMHARGHAEEVSAEKIDRALQKAKEDWNNYFFHAISDVAKGHTPSKIFVTVDSDVAPFFVSSIKDNLSSAQKNTTDFQAIPVILLDEEKLSQFVEFDGQAKRDPFLALESIFFNKLFNTISE